MEDKIPGYFRPVLQVIRHGEDQAVTVSEISKLTLYNSDDIRHIVSQSVIKYGLGIATSKTGYYYITNADEKDATSKNLKSRAFTLLERAKKIDALPANGQQEIDFDELFAG